MQWNQAITQYKSINSCKEWCQKYQTAKPKFLYPNTFEKCQIWLLGIFENARWQPCIPTYSLYIWCSVFNSHWWCWLDDKTDVRLVKSTATTFRGAGDDEGQGGQPRTWGQSVASWPEAPPPLNFGLSENLLVRNFSSKNANFEAENSYFWEISGQNWNFEHPCSVFNSMHSVLSVEILWEIFSVCRKIANSCPAYFFNPRRHWGLHRGPGHRSLHKSQFTSQVLNRWFT